jgi:AcrR family transcriptional regulator
MAESAIRFGTTRAYPRLPRGRHGLEPEYVADYQRRRLAVTVAELAHERGMAGVTVSAIVDRARVSRKTFYDFFENCDACADHAAEVAADYLSAAGEDAEALLAAVAAEPNLAELALIHAPAFGGERGRRFQDRAIETVSRAFGSPLDAPRAPGSEPIASAISGLIAYGLVAARPA